MSEENKDPISPLEMSDDDFLKAGPPSVEGFNLEDNTRFDEAPKQESQEEPPESTENQDPDKDADSQAQDKGQGDTEANEGTEGSEEGEGGDEGQKNKGSEDSNVASEEEVKEAKEKTEEVVDYKATHDKIFAPFKANGKEIQIKSVDDAIALMQMGANYNKKMAALKPNLALMKLLEKNNLLDEGKLSFLIDLDKKNPEAISKLVKDSGIDPLDLDAEKASGYKPNTYTVDQTEIELDSVIEDIKTSDSYHRTIDLVGNKWDAASRKVVAEHPQILKMINQHIESGVYDIISAEVEREKLFGRLDGLSDIAAYKQIGDAIAAKGGFNHLSPQGKPTPPAVTKPAPKVNQEAIDKLKDQKRAASSTKAAAPGASKTSKEFNPFAMSDEEFAKVSIDKFIT